MSNATELYVVKAYKLNSHHRKAITTLYYFTCFHSAYIYMEKLIYDKIIYNCVHGMCNKICDDCKIMINDCVNCKIYLDNDELPNYCIKHQKNIETCRECKKAFEPIQDDSIYNWHCCDSGNDYEYYVLETLDCNMHNKSKPIITSRIETIV